MKVKTRQLIASLSALSAIAITATAFADAGMRDRDAYSGSQRSRAEVRAELNNAWTTPGVPMVGWQQDRQAPGIGVRGSPGARFSAPAEQGRGRWWQSNRTQTNDWNRNIYFGD